MFKIGENVKWVSSYKGVDITRYGKIIYIVDEFCSINDILSKKILQKLISKNFNIVFNTINTFLPHKSYLILVGDRDGKIPSIHWPDVNLLQKVIKRKNNKRKKIV